MPDFVWPYAAREARGAAAPVARQKQSMIPLNMHPSFIKNEDKLTEDKKEVSISTARYDFWKIMMGKLDEKQKLMITLASAENGAAVHGLQHLYLKRMDTS